MTANQKLLNAFLGAMFDEPVTLVGNSMGGMISILQGAAEPGSVARLVLVDPSVPTPDDEPGDPTVVAIFTAYATPGVGEEMMRSASQRMRPEDLVRQMMGLCCVDVERLDEDVLEAHFDLADERAGMEWAITAHLEAARSLLDLKLRNDDFYELIRKVRVPVLVIQGDRDRLIPISSIRALQDVRPDWEFEIYDEIGHLPMLECPDRFLSSVTRWLAPRRVIDLTKKVAEEATS